MSDFSLLKFVQCVKIARLFEKCPKHTYSLQTQRAFYWTGGAYHSLYFRKLYFLSMFSRVLTVHLTRQVNKMFEIVFVCNWIESSMVTESCHKSFFIYVTLKHFKRKKHKKAVTKCIENFTYYIFFNFKYLFQIF